MNLRSVAFLTAALLLCGPVHSAGQEASGAAEGHLKVRESKRASRRTHAHEHHTRQAAVQSEAGDASGAAQLTRSQQLQNSGATEVGQVTEGANGVWENGVKKMSEASVELITGKDRSGGHSLHSVDQTLDPSSHQASSGGGDSIPRDPFVWDGEPSWEWDYQRTLYFEAVAGLGNRLRGLASAVVMAKEYGVGLKVIWRLEEGCGDACGNPGFNSSWPDLFLEPKLRLVDNFPGSNYTNVESTIFLRADNRDGLPPIVPGHNCTVHAPHTHQEMKSLLDNNWTHVNGEEVLCVRSDLWLTEAGEKEGKFFFRLLKPSAAVQLMIDTFKYETEWEENHMVGVHVRRGDLTIYGKDNQHSKVRGLIPIESYVESMRKQKELAAGVKRVRFFLATDDAEAEAEIKAAFKPGYVLTYQKTERSRLSVLGIREALVDVMLLADCPVLIGTYYSSYSETAKMMGWPFYIQVGHALKSLSVETVFEKEDPDEEEVARRRLIEHELW